MKTWKVAIIFVIVSAFVLVGVYYLTTDSEKVDLPVDKPISVSDFNDCVKAGNPVMESYPRQCRHGDLSFTENIGNTLEKGELIFLASPRPNDIVSSPLNINGQARGNWFFEGDFPVVLTDWDGRIIAEGYATADGEWMTEEFVDFTATLEFDSPTLYDNGSLILQKDNPSGLPENDDALEIPIQFK